MKKRKRKPDRERDAAAILRLKEQLSEKIKKANEQLKQINKQLIGNHEKLEVSSEQTKILLSYIRRSRAAISRASEHGQKQTAMDKNER